MDRETSGRKLAKRSAGVAHLSKRMNVSFADVSIQKVKDYWNSYAKKSVKQLVGSGFEVTDIFTEHIFPYTISKYVKHEYEKEWYFRHMPSSVFRRLKNLGWHLCVTAKVKNNL